MGSFSDYMDAVRSMGVDVQRDTSTTAKAAARLCNFVTNRAELLPGHKLYLMTEFKEAMQTFDSPFVRIVGYASRKGTAKRNLQLSKERMESVGTAIASLGMTVNFDKVRYVGADESGENAKDNAGYYRAVAVYCYGTPPPPVPEVPIEVKPIANQYVMRYHSGGSFGVGPIAMDAINFEIADVVRKMSVLFYYIGLNATIPIKGNPIPVSGSGKGPWSKTFRTTRPTLLTTFEGTVDIVAEPGATVGNASLHGKLHVEFPLRTDDEGDLKIIPNQVVVEGGPGFQMPNIGSLGVGRLIMKGKPTGWSPKD